VLALLVRRLLEELGEAGHGHVVTAEVGRLRYKREENTRFLKR
jgi:hypothetical protein